MATYLTSNIYSDVNITGNCIVSGSFNQSMFRNRLYNGNFQVWQRGATFNNIGTNTYTADRWVTPTNAGAGSTLTVILVSDVPSGTGFTNSMQILSTATTGAPSLIEQRIEAINVYDLLAGTYVTVSFWAKQNTPATPVTLNVQLGYPTVVNTFTTFNSAATPPVVGNTLTVSSWKYYKATFQLNTNSQSTNGLTIQFWINSVSAATNISIAGVQLEKGFVATPFEFRPYPVELQLCQRYYYQFNSTSSTVLPGGAPSFTFFGTGLAYTTTQAFIFIQYPVQMRSAVQTFSNSSPVSNFVILAPASSTVTSLALGSDSTSPTGCRVDVGATLTAGQAVVLRANQLGGGTTCFLAFSCEL